jgi:hypothetical protein
MIPLYIHRHSPIHRIAAGPKLLLLLAASTAIFFLDPLWLLLATLLGTIGLYRLARLPLAAIAGALRPVLIVGALIFALQLFLAGPGEAARILLRLFTAILLVSLVTLTTRFSDMLDVLTRLTRPLARFGLDPPRLALDGGRFRRQSSGGAFGQTPDFESKKSDARKPEYFAGSELARSRQSDFKIRARSGQCRFIR